MKRPEPDRVRVLLASLEKFRKALVEKEREVEDLKEELAEVGGKLPPPLTPEEEKKKEDEDERRKRSERLKVINEKSEALRAKILQRKDKALRAQGLDELTPLLQSGDSEELLLGLWVLQQLSGITFDEERFKPYVLAALANEDPEIRRTALNSLDRVYPREEMLDALLPLANDPSPEVRRHVAGRIRRMGGDERREEVASVLRKLLHDEDESVRREALDGLSRMPAYAEEMENLAIELSKNAENPREMMGWLGRRDTISARVARRLVEMYDEGQTGYNSLDWTRRRLSDEAKPIAIDFCLRVVRDSIEYYERYRALAALQSIGDATILQELQVIADTDDAEGIESHLKRTMEYIQRRAERQR